MLPSPSPPIVTIEQLEPRRVQLAWRRRTRVAGAEQDVDTREPIAIIYYVIEKTEYDDDGLPTRNWTYVGKVSARNVLFAHVGKLSR